MQHNKKRRADSSIQTNHPPKKKQKTNKSKNNKNKHNQKISAWQSPNHCISWLLFNKKIVSTDTFFKDYFGTKAYLIRRNNDNYYSQQRLKFELKDVYQIIKQNELKFGQHMICKSYDGNKEHEVPWIKSNDKISVTQFKKIMQKGYTVQFHHPQHFYNDITKMVGLLESHFGVEVGCNVYITPSKKQGLAPHWDDVDVFVLQIEGKKHWKLYERTEDENKYPLKSSDDLNLERDCQDAKLIMECELNPGDLLYFPRGIIHYAKTVGKSHSTHITISTHQRATWGDFIQTLMDKALNEAIDNNMGMRMNMPLNFLSYMGSTFEYNENDAIQKKQQVFMEKLQDIVNDVVATSMQNAVHQTCDVIGADFISHRLPPSFMLNGGKNKKKKHKDIEVNESIKVGLKSIDWIRVVNDDEMDDEEMDEIESEDDTDNEDVDDENDYIYKDKETGINVKMIDMKDTQNEDNKDVTSFVDDSDDEEEEDDQDIDIEESEKKEKEEDDDDDEDEEDMGEFRLYSCITNNIGTHCVEFKDEPKNDGESYIKLPMYLRPVIDTLINIYPKMLTVQQLFNKCNELTNDVTLSEIQELIKLLHDMQLIKLIK